MDKKNSRKSRSLKHLRGCNCKRSGCVKKYCECFNEQVACTIKCRCEGCHNSHEHRAQPKVSSALPAQDVVEDGGEGTGSFQLSALNENSSNVPMPMEVARSLEPMEGDDLFSEEYANQGSDTTNREMPVDDTLIATQRALFEHPRPNATEANNGNSRCRLIAQNVIDCVLHCLVTRVTESLLNNMTNAEVNAAVNDELRYCVGEIIKKLRE